MPINSADLVDAGLGSGSGATIPGDPDQILRGAYLAKAYGCAVCHTPIGRVGPEASFAYAGRAVVPDELGSWTSPNLTPDTTGLAGWSDDQIIAAIRTGERPDGTHLDAMMPWAAYAGMTNQDARAIVAFLRTIPAVKNRVPRVAHRPTPATQAFIGATMANVDATAAIAIAGGSNEKVRIPEAGVGAAAATKPVDEAAGTSPAGAVDPVDDPVKHGKYLVAMMGCAGCHAGSNSDDAKQQFVGGRELVMPLSGSGVVYAANITSDRATGIGGWTSPQIIAALRTMVRPDGTAISGPMRLYAPYWNALDQRDLDAVAAYVKTIPAVRHRVPKSTFVANHAGELPGEIPAGDTIAPTSRTPVVAFDNNGMPGDAGVVIPDRLPIPKADCPISLFGYGGAQTAGTGAYGGGGTQNAGLGAGGSGAGGGSAGAAAAGGYGGGSASANVGGSNGAGGNRNGSSGPYTVSNTVANPSGSATSGVHTAGTYGTASAGATTTGSNGSGATNNANGANGAGSGGSSNATTQPNGSPTAATPGAPNNGTPATAGIPTTSQNGGAGGGGGGGNSAPGK